MLNQTFEFEDLGTVGLLVLLEGVLSVDNALVLGVLANRVPRNMASRVLAYGLAGAFIFRLLAVALATYLIEFSAIQPIGAAYLLYLVIRRFFFKPPKKEPNIEGNAPFWRTVFVIELTDMAFAVDNVLAAVALVGPAPGGSKGLHPKLWVILTGGMMGVILTRFAATVCIGLMRKFPRLDASAYLIVLLVACKLGLEWLGLDFESTHQAPFWVFWTLLIGILMVGFLARRTSSLPPPPVSG
jgi:YkoY family integral membrane protein